MADRSVPDHDLEIRSDVGDCSHGGSAGEVHQGGGEEADREEEPDEV